MAPDGMNAAGRARGACAFALWVLLAGCDGCGTEPEATGEEEVPQRLQDDDEPDPDEPQGPKERVTVPPESLSTDDGVRAAYEKATGEELRRACIDRPEELEGIVLVGGFAYDRGCMPTAVFVDGTYYEEREATPVALDHLGWNEPDADRAEIALTWLAKGWARYRGDWQESAEPIFDAGGAGDFHPPEARELDDGSVVVHVWMEEPSGMRASRDVERMAIRIDAEGQLESRTLETFATR